MSERARIPEKQVTPRFKAATKPPKGKASKSRALAVIQDRDAAEIGELYAKSNEGVVQAVLDRLACGNLLRAKKGSLAHGEWGEWLRKNEKVLGFAQSAANKMMAAAARYSELATNLSPEMAQKISRAMWGHADSQLVQQSTTNEHYTPTKYLDSVRAVLGSIALDPASCDEANERVQAETFYSEGGLEREWEAETMWLNPPYGGEAGKFIEKMRTAIDAGDVGACICVVNAHCTDTSWFQLLWDGLLCFTDHRVDFHGDGERSGSTHGSVFVYFGPDPELFAEHFTQFGAIVQRWRLGRVSSP